MDEETVVCACMNVSIGDIKRAIEAGGNSFQALQEMTGISTVCGICQEEAETIIMDLLKERNG